MPQASILLLGLFASLPEMSDDTNETDVRLASETEIPDATGAAPSMPLPARSLVDTKPYSGSIRLAADVLQPGERIDDFEIEVVLGRGAFGVVYLARQLSLDRQVALKIAANHGSEGRTMARLEHKHIVQVFSETVDSSGSLKLLCMQLVPGAPLNDVIHDLAQIRRTRGHWTGADVLASVDERSKLTDIFDPSALRDREALAQMDDLQATCWIGARLAEAVDYAHRQGVLHRDMKPANVLVNRYGQPLLADFNISFQSLDETTSADERFGGTLYYMAPEHLDAFHPGTETNAEAVDQQSDLYSLGIVICETLDGNCPIVSPPRCEDRIETLERMAIARSAAAPAVIPGAGDAAKAFSYTVARCLDPDPAKRYASGAELAEALEGVRELRTRERRLHSDDWLARSIEARPILWVIIMSLAPQFLGSLFNISYNLTQICTKLSPEQLEVFHQLLLGYNFTVYPLAVLAGTLLLVPLLRVWKRLIGTTPVDQHQLDWARRRSLMLPMWLLAVAAGGWLPGGVVFPWLIEQLAGSAPPGLYGHFFASFTISGLIAVAYSLCGVQYVSLRGLYARLWPRAETFQQTAERELPPTRWRLGLMLGLAFIVPTFAAGMLLLTAEDANVFSFRLLTVSLMLGGGLGFTLLLGNAVRLWRMIDQLTGVDRRR